MNKTLLNAEWLLHLVQVGFYFTDRSLTSLGWIHTFLRTFSSCLYCDEYNLYFNGLWFWHTNVLWDQTSSQRLAWFFPCYTISHWPGTWKRTHSTLCCLLVYVYKQWNLSHRRPSVHFRQSSISVASLSRSVPQWSILGPLLCNLFWAMRCYKNNIFFPLFCRCANLFTLKN